MEMTVVYTQEMLTVNREHQRVFSRDNKGPASRGTKYLIRLAKKARNENMYLCLHPLRKRKKKKSRSIRVM